MAPEDNRVETTWSTMVGLQRQSGRCFLAYVTANDSPYYVADFLNFRHMTRSHPGVSRIVLYIAISRVRPWSQRDRRAVDGLTRLAAACPWFDVRAVLWKGNVGRDFSSAEACLQALALEASLDDFIMVRNRSAYGPSRSDWYLQYVEQYARVAQTGLVGSTINLSGHPKRPVAGPATHVQTYAYLSQVRHLAVLTPYPASRCVDRLELINEGEVGLSRSMFERGLGISCLLWPDQHFTRERLRCEELPQADIKRTARDLALRYKYPSYFWRAADLPAQLAWLTRLKLQRHRARNAPASIQQVNVDQYG